MDSNQLLQGLLLYLCFIPVLTFHEFAHAWVAWKCGDDTAKDLGRVSLNPIVHMEMVGTVVLPLIAIMLSVSGSALAGFIIGWGKPVPVNINNLKNPRWDDSMIALAGPGMNILLAILLMGVVKAGQLLGGGTVDAPGYANIMIEAGILLVTVNLFLAFFNLIPIPPLDGSHVLRNITDMSYETYIRIAQMGFILVIIVINIPGVRQALSAVTFGTMAFIAKLYGIG